MNLQDLGFRQFFLSQLEDFAKEFPNIARIYRVDRGVASGLGAMGSISIKITKEEHSLVVGDFCIVEGNADDSHYNLKRILDRSSYLRRMRPGQQKPQGIAANIDNMFIVTAMNEEFKLSRVERYLIAAKDSGADPILVLTKQDLCMDEAAFDQKLESMSSALPTFKINSLTGEGIENLQGYLGKGQTIALIGSSGVGKSTLTNYLTDSRQQVTQELSFFAKGKHTTTARELFATHTGALIIDTPGMKEIAPVMTESTISDIFDEIESLATQCRFSNCSHETEPGCAIQKAIKSGQLTERRLKNFQKLQREQRRTHDKGYQAAEKKRWKSITKSMRKFKREQS
ncbi:MAG: ribosome small subunit-dependent GTPase A [Pseudobacteriovorax sp.]|nr:ribosome small subunit-dependent GTPase A [Pseudobacteriovorax sp.]